MSRGEFYRFILVPSLILSGRAIPYVLSGIVVGSLLGSLSSGEVNLLSILMILLVVLVSILVLSMVVHYLYFSSSRKSQ